MGEQLASLSGLPSGTAMAHLMAITTGGGASETVYVSSMCVVTTRQERVVYRRPKRPEELAPAEAARTRDRSVINKKSAYIMPCAQEARVFSGSDAVFVFHKEVPSTVMSVSMSVTASRAG